MSEQQRATDMSRRAFIRLAVGTTAATTGGLLLAACGETAAPGSPATAPASSAASIRVSVSAGSSVAGANSTTSAAPSLAAAVGAKTAAALPSFIAQRPFAPPDFDSTDPKLTLAYNHYPKNPPKSWDKPAPGTGSNVTAFVPNYYPPPTPFANNPTWHAVNKALNANFQMTMVSGADYLLKIGTLMAGDDLPDFIHIAHDIASPPGLADFYKAKCQDLTPFLSGDNIKEYPNLANIPTYAWINSGSVIDGQLFQWPISRYLPGITYFFKNTDMWDAKVGKDVVPKSADDLKKMMQQLNDPKGGVWAIGNLPRRPTNFGIRAYVAMFGGPNFWGLDSSGKIVKDYETEQYKAALAYVRDLWAAGLFWPDSASTSDSRTNFVARKFAMSVEGFGNSWNDFWLRGLTQNPSTHFDIIMPFGADAKTKAQSFLTGGFNATNVMKKSSPDRVKELLRILDYLAKPFGTQEDLLISYGLSPDDYTIDSNGDPQLTKDGKNRSQYVPWQYLSDRRYVTYYAGIDGYAAHVHPIEQALVDPKIAVSDASLGLYAPTSYLPAATQAEQTLLDGVNDIITGRRQLSEFDGLVNDWRKAVGDKLKGEYNDALAKQKG